MRKDNTVRKSVRTKKEANGELTLGIDAGDQSLLRLGRTGRGCTISIS